MAESIRIRVYNVRFGDAILVTVPDRDPETDITTTRHILFDVGNVLSGEGGADTVFEPVVADILRVLDGNPLDLYVMTHEHLDHVQGLYYAATKLYEKGELKKLLDTQYAWLSASAALDYYDTHPEAKKQKLALDAAYKAISSHLHLYADNPEVFEGLLANNNPSSTKQCVDFLRELAPKKRTFFVHRDFDTEGRHPFNETKFEIWGPEEDTSDYYKKKGFMLDAMDLLVSGKEGKAEEPVFPPHGVDAGAFYNLVARRASGIWSNLLMIDKAANNTSVVLALNWRGKRLLFAGDAEIESWKMMVEQGVLDTIDFIKVSHHGSHNGTPDADVLDNFMPLLSTGHVCTGVISTWAETYNGIPHDPTNHKLADRCHLHSTLDQPDALYFDTFVEES